MPTVDTNLVQSLINIMECQLEEAFEATRGGGAGGRKQSLSKSKASAGAEEAEAMDPKVWLSIDALSCRICPASREQEAVHYILTHLPYPPTVD